MGTWVPLLLLQDPQPSTPQKGPAQRGHPMASGSPSCWLTASTRPDPEPGLEPGGSLPPQLLPRCAPWQPQGPSNLNVEPGRGARPRGRLRGQWAALGPFHPSPPTKPLPHPQAPAFSPGVALSTQDPCPAKTTSLGPIQALGTPRPGPRTRGRETPGASQGGCRTQGRRGAWLWSRGGLGCGHGGAGSGTGCLSADPALAPGEAGGRPCLPGPEAPTLGSGGRGLWDGGL